MNMSKSQYHPNMCSSVALLRCLPAARAEIIYLFIYVFILDFYATVSMCGECQACIYYSSVWSIHKSNLEMQQVKQSVLAGTLFCSQWTGLVVRGEKMIDREIISTGLPLQNEHRR